VETVWVTHMYWTSRKKLVEEKRPSLFLPQSLWQRERERKSLSTSAPAPPSSTLWQIKAVKVLFVVVDEKERERKKIVFNSLNVVVKEEKIC
jgi:hypothetical protein